MAPSASGPRPEVLARLAQGAPAGPRAHTVSPGARALGVALCIVTAATVVVAVLVAGVP